MAATRRRLVRWLVAALVLVVVVVVAQQNRGAGSTTHQIFRLRAGSGFAVTGSVTGLTPGAQSSLVLTLTNPVPFDLSVTQVSVALDPTKTQPTTCAASNLDLSHTQFNDVAHPLTVPAHTGAGDGTLNLSLPITLVNVNSDQNGCRNQTFNLVYTGSAQYTEVIPTAAGLTTSGSPSLAAQPLTFTATVTATAQPPYGGPTGRVQFYDGSAALGTPVNLPAVTPSSASTLSATASYTTSTMSAGVHSIKAVYTNLDGNFVGATSPVITQVVDSPCTTTKVSKLTVTNGQALCITTGGDASGGVTVNSGGYLTLLNGGSATGGIAVQPGGNLIINVGTVGGGLTSTGAGILQLCGATINGGITVQTSAGFVLIGDGGDDGTPRCTRNNIGGGLKVLNNSHGVEIGGNSITGGLTWTNNSGAGAAADDTTPELEGNTISGGLACTGSTGSPNTTAISNDHQPNSVTGARTGNMACSGATF